MGYENTLKMQEVIEALQDSISKNINDIKIPLRVISEEEYKKPALREAYIDEVRTAQNLCLKECIHIKI